MQEEGKEEVNTDTCKCVACSVPAYSTRCHKTVRFEVGKSFLPRKMQILMKRERRRVVSSTDSSRLDADLKSKNRDLRLQRQRRRRRHQCCRSLASSLQSTPRGLGPTEPSQNDCLHEKEGEERGREAHCTTTFPLLLPSLTFPRSFLRSLAAKSAF